MKRSKKLLLALGVSSIILCCLFVLFDMYVLDYRRVLSDDSVFVEENEQYVSIINEDEEQYYVHVFEKEKLLGFTLYPEYISMEITKGDLRREEYSTTILNADSQTHVFILAENREGYDELEIVYDINGYPLKELENIPDGCFLKHFIYGYEFDNFPEVTFK